MPPALLNAYSARLAPLSAEESLVAAERIAVGTGSLRKGEGRRVAAGWRRQADQHVPRIRAASKEHYQAHMAGLGIAVKPAAKVADG